MRQTYENKFGKVKGLHGNADPGLLFLELDHEHLLRSDAEPKLYSEGLGTWTDRMSSSTDWAVAAT